MALEAVRARLEPEGRRDAGDLEDARDLRPDLDAARAARALALDHPAGDLLEARPPQRPDLRAMAEVLEQLPADVEQALLGVVGQVVADGP